jgi:DNA-binding GntR family transcriptional regulator
MFDTRLLARHVLRAMTVAQKQGATTSLEGLAELLGVRRVDVRTAVSALHKEGLIDALRMKTTLMGFTIGSALNPLAPLRRLETLAA